MCRFLKWPRGRSLITSTRCGSYHLQTDSSLFSSNIIYSATLRLNFCPYHFAFQISIILKWQIWSTCCLGPFCVVFSQSPCAHMACLQVLQFPLTNQIHVCCIGYSESSLGVSESVNHCLSCLSQPSCFDGLVTCLGCTLSLAQWQLKVDTSSPMTQKWNAGK